MLVDRGLLHSQGMECIGIIYTDFEFLAGKSRIKQDGTRFIVFNTDLEKLKIFIISHSTNICVKLLVQSRKNISMTTAKIFVIALSSSLT